MGNKSTAVIVGFLALAISLAISYLPDDRHVETGEMGAGETGDLRLRELPLPLPKQVGEVEISHADFSGSEACAECHLEMYDLWRNSTHGRAGGDPDRVEIVARFDGRSLVFADAVVTPVNRKGNYLFVVKPMEGPEFDIEIEAVVGGGLMMGGGTQAFFAKAPDGTVRFLPFDFSRHGDHWFVQLNKNHHWVPVSRDIALTDLANWPPHRALGTYEGSSNCQNCHGSQITLGYNEQERRFETRYTTLSINCESCHGPAKRHVELMRSANAADLAQIGLASLSTLSKDESLLVCFRCHATKDAVQPDYIDGKPLERYFSLKLPILAKELHTPDGRVRSFSYQENHLFSDCYINGSMTCVDCHAPHALTYRDNFGRALQGRFDNGQCTGCHANLEETPELHSHHKSGSKGNLCVSCHMPYLQAQGIGDQITYGRSDHLIAIPRPEYDASIGIENACLKCHPDKSTEVLEEQTRAWYGEVKPLNILVRRLLEAKAVTDYDQASDLLLNSRPHHPIAQVTGLFEFLKRFMTVNMVSADEQVIGQLKAMSSSSDLDLRAFSMMALHFAYGQHSGVREFLADQLQSAAGDDAAIRGRWALALDYLGSRYAMSSQYDDAVACFEKAIEVRPDDPVVFSNLAKAHRDHGDNTAAIEAFRTAIQLQPASPRYYFQLAKTYAQMRRDTEAIQVLEQGLIRAPDDKSARRLLRQLRQQERL